MTLKDLELRVSVIIPVFSEQEIINGAIKAVRRLGGGDAVEIIVVDGQPEGETLAVIQDAAVRKLRSEKGRGRQLNCGAAVARGDGLVFLHADTVLPPAALERIADVLNGKDCVGGAFDLRIASRRKVFRVIEAFANLRSRLTRIPYGDQAVFIGATYFRNLGGFKDLPLLEDVELMQRIKRAGGRIVICRERVSTSARRWEKEGVVFGTLRNWVLVVLYLCGVAPERLVRFYR